MPDPATPVAPVTTQAPAAAVVSTPDSKVAETQVPVAKVEDAKPAAKDAATDPKTPEVKPPVVPDKYDLKLPDGSLLKQDDVAKLASLAKERGLSNDDAQKLLTERSEAKAGLLAEQKNEFTNLRATWQEQLLNDPELGGDNAKATAENAKRFVDRYASDALKKAFNDTGFGDHPELVRLMSRAGKSMAEDRAVMPKSQGSPSAFEAKDILYPSMKTKE